MSATTLSQTSDVETEELRSCPNCGSGNLRGWCAGRDRLYEVSGQDFTYSRCRACRLVFLSVRPVEGEAHKFYPRHYGPYQASSGNGKAPKGGSHARRSAPARLAGRVITSLNYRFGRLFPDAFAEEFHSFYRPREAGQTLLDFGCGSEAFLNWAREQGWSTVGVDFSEETIEQVRASGHKGILMTPTALGEIEDGSLDFVRMNHVLEHLYRPKEILRTLNAKMRPGATLHIGVPNPFSLTSRLFGSRWFSLDCPRHVILYSPNVLQKLLGEVGFSDLEVLHETVTKDFARSLGYLLHDRGRMRADEVEKMMYRQGLAALLYVPARLASALGMADRFHVFAKK